eukprot:jgi/Mesen1/9665/ME000671S09010
MVSFKIQKVGHKFSSRPLPIRAPCGTLKARLDGTVHPLENILQGEVSSPPQTGENGQRATSAKNLKRKRNIFGITVEEEHLGGVSPLKLRRASFFSNARLHAPHWPEEEGQDAEFTKGKFAGDECEDVAVSLVVNVLPTGFSVGPPPELGRRSRTQNQCFAALASLTQEDKELPSVQEAEAVNLYPYDRSSHDFLQAIDQGRLPPGMLDDLPCTYIDGCVVCEVRDYRDAAAMKAGEAFRAPGGRSAAELPPKVHRVVLRPSTETIASDVAALADDSWSYQDILEVEAAVTRAVQPPLCLDPSPRVAAAAWALHYNQAKSNVGMPKRQRYRGAVDYKRAHKPAPPVYCSPPGKLQEDEDQMQAKERPHAAVSGAAQVAGPERMARGAAGPGGRHASPASRGAHGEALIAASGSDGAASKAGAGASFGAPGAR